MRAEDAVSIARGTFMTNGDVIFVQSNGQIQHPHLHSGQDFGDLHTDGWAVKMESYRYYAAKIHDDDWLTGAIPTFREVF